MLVLLLFEELLGINELRRKYTPTSVKRNAQKNSQDTPLLAHGMRSWRCFHSGNHRSGDGSSHRDFTSGGSSYISYVIDLTKASCCT